MNEEQKKEAEALIEKYFKIVFNGHNKIQDDFEYGKAKKSAQLECQSIIKELELIDRNPEYVIFDVKDEYGMRQNTNDRITHYQSLIKSIEAQ